MNWIPTIVPLAALVLKEILNFIERRHWSEERARLIQAALETSPQAAAAAVRPPRKQDEPVERAKLPLGL